MSSGRNVSAAASRASGPTAYSRSPRRRSGARLVTRTCSGGTDISRSLTSGAASSTCSKLSSTSSVARSWQATRARLGKSATVMSENPKPSAIAEAARAASPAAASGTKTTRAASSAAVARAISSARRVFPTPPGPMRVTRRRARPSSHWRTICSSASRPRSGVNGTGSAVAPNSSAAARAGPRALERKAS